MNSKLVRTALWGAGMAVMTVASFVGAEKTSARDASDQSALRGEDLLIASCGGWLEPRCPTTNVTSVRG